MLLFKCPSVYTVLILNFQTDRLGEQCRRAVSSVFSLFANPSDFSIDLPFDLNFRMITTEPGKGHANFI